MRTKYTLGKWSHFNLVFGEGGIRGGVILIPEVGDYAPPSRKSG